MSQPHTFRCLLHGSYRKHFSEIQAVRQLFSDAGIEVLAPTAASVIAMKGGFTILNSDQETDSRMIELRYLQHLKRLGENGFSYFINPDGYVGTSVSYELGIAQACSVPCFFLAAATDHPVYTPQNTIWQPNRLVAYLKQFNQLPPPRIKHNERLLHQLWCELIVPGSVVAVGAIIEYGGGLTTKEKEVLFVKTHKWGDRYSVIGEKVRRNERLNDALIRGIKEETGLTATVGADICTFDQLQDSGYYQTGIQHIFVDRVARVHSRKIQLNHEAEDYIWLPASVALNELPLEPNARLTLKYYLQMT